MIDTRALAFDTKTFRGSYLLFRKDGDRLKKERRGAARAPRFRHPNFTSAEAEAKRLLNEYPESTFIILQEVARVKTAGDAANPAAAPPGASDDVAHVAIPVGGGQRAVLALRFGGGR